MRRTTSSAKSTRNAPHSTFQTTGYTVEYKNPSMIICLTLTPRRACSEYRGSHANYGRPFFDCGFKIVTHTHRQFARAAMEKSLRRQPISYTAKPYEKRACRLRVLEERRQHHQPIEPKAFTAIQKFDQTGHVALSDARLGLLTG